MFRNRRENNRCLYQATITCFNMEVKMNIRIATLEKKTTIPFGYRPTDISMADKETNWIVMGHFDFLSMSTLKIEKDFFDSIYMNNRSLLSTTNSGSYYYPIYLMPIDDDSNFFNMSTTFSALIKVHFVSSLDYEKSYSLLKENLSLSRNFYNVNYEIYKTFELSDLVVLVKDNKLSNILNCNAELRSYSFVGKICTYPMISINAFDDVNNFYEDDKINYLSIRFSLCSSAQMNQVVSSVKDILNVEKAYSITGVDDLLFNCVDICARDIYNFYNEISTVNLNHKSKKLSSLISKIGIIIGDDIIFDENALNDDSYETLLSACTKMLLLLDKNKKEIEKRKYTWFNSLFELIKLLSRMLLTPVLDEFVYLLLPGMLAFVKNIDFICNSEIETEQYPFEYNKFVQSLTDLIEQIMRSEGQLSSSPELRPIMYNLPIIMLEHTQAFLKKCSELLKKNDGMIENIRLLLVPKIVDRLETIEIFPATEHDAGLIEISIPIDMLYNPEQLQCSLCHEISHFIGEYHRKREERITYYSKAVSILMSKLLFNDFSKNRIDAINKQLIKLIKNDKPVDGKYTIRHMQTIVEDWIENWCSNLNCYSNFVRQLLFDIPNNEKINISCDVDEIYYYYSNHFSILLEDLGRLFKEIYSDICMLFLLPITSEEYIEQFASELVGEPLEYPYDDVVDEKMGSELYEIFAIRIYVCLKATERHLPNKSKSKLAYFNAICDKIKDIDLKIKSDDESDSYIPLGSVYQLIKYATECYKSLKDRLFDDSELEYLRDNVLENKEDIDYDKIVAFINDYRKELLDYFNNNR